VTRTAIVVGGGIGGLAAARALEQTGWEVTLFEQAPEVRAVGAGIGLAPNAVARSLAEAEGGRLRWRIGSRWRRPVRVPVAIAEDPTNLRLTCEFVESAQLSVASIRSRRASVTCGSTNGAPGTRQSARSR
jgi:hypothetical protein